MKRISLAALLACCALVFSLSGCSGGSSTTKADAESLKGFWEMDPSASLGFEGILNLDDDNFAELQLADSYLEGTWSADGSQAKIVFGEEGDTTTANIYVSDGKLVLGQEGGSKIVFIKSDMDAYFEEADGENSELIEIDGSEDSEIADLSELDGVEAVDEVIDDITPVTVADDDVVKIEVTGKGTDFTGDPGYRLSITNKTSKTIYVVGEDLFKVNGKKIEAGLGELVEANETVETFMYFSTDDLGGGLDALKSVEGVFVVGDDDSSDELGKYTFKMD